MVKDRTLLVQCVTWRPTVEPAQHNAKANEHHTKHIISGHKELTAHSGAPCQFLNTNKKAEEPVFVTIRPHLKKLQDVSFISHYIHFRQFFFFLPDALSQPDLKYTL